MRQMWPEGYTEWLESMHRSMEQDMYDACVYSNRVTGEWGGTMLNVSYETLVGAHEVMIKAHYKKRNGWSLTQTVSVNPGPRVTLPETHPVTPSTTEMHISRVDYDLIKTVISTNRRTGTRREDYYYEEC
jgi:hypothetical protein